MNSRRKRITYVPARETSKCINLATICRSVGPGLNCNLWHTKKCIALINSYFWTHSVEIPDILQQLPLLASNIILNTNPIKWRGAVCLHVKIVTIGLSTWIQHTGYFIFWGQLTCFGENLRQLKRVSGLFTLSTCSPESIRPESVCSQLLFALNLVRSI